jgi:hypothetical protein
VSRRLDRHELLAVTAELRAELLRLCRELDRLRVENEVLQETAEPLIHLARAHERFAFALDAHGAPHAVLWGETQEAAVLASAIFAGTSL